MDTVCQSFSAPWIVRNRQTLYTNCFTSKDPESVRQMARNEGGGVPAITKHFQGLSFFI